MPELVIDSHIHCGVQNISLPFGEIEPLLKNAGIDRACLFAPVEDIYYRYSSDFDDNDAWSNCRQCAHDYLLQVAAENEHIYPYYFVWSDFLVEELDKGFKGIKWHHHAGEPEYKYHDPRCREMIEAICSRKLLVVLEETFALTLEFINWVAGRTAVVIPHLGMLNGGFDRLMRSGIWDAGNVYADTALAGEGDISTFVEKYGADRLLYGSDYPFGTPAHQLKRLYTLGLNSDELDKICSENILRLLEIK